MMNFNILEWDIDGSMKIVGNNDKIKSIIDEVIKYYEKRKRYKNHELDSSIARFR